MMPALSKGRYLEPSRSTGTIEGGPVNNSGVLAISACLRRKLGRGVRQIRSEGTAG